MERIMHENNELKKKYDSLQQDEKEKFEEIKKKLRLRVSSSLVVESQAQYKRACVFAITLIGK